MSRNRRKGLAAALVALLVGSWADAPAAAGGFELSQLDAPYGINVHGAASPDLTGSSVARAGDVNDDGLDDLIIGASGAGPNGFTSGRAYVVFGRDEEFSFVTELFALDGTDGFAINGALGGDFAGVSVAAAGDVNADGIDDVIIGAYAADPNGASSGATYVVFGRTDPFPAAVELAALDGTDGFVMNGVTSPDRSGISASGAGDVNDDGVDDVIIGALNSAAHGAATGSSYVVFGRTTPFPAAIELASLDGSNGFAMNGVAAGDHAGVTVAAAGDVNGDGIADVVIGAPGAGASGASTGTAYVVFGSSSPFPALLELASLSGANGFACRGGASGDNAGTSVAGAGDVNGDGLADVIIGASFVDASGLNAGAAHVVFGSDLAFPATLDLSALDGTDGFAILGAEPGDHAGAGVSAAGDFNGDLIDDVVIGAKAAAPNGSESGAAAVIFGRTLGFPAAINLLTLDGTAGFVLNGELAGDQTGASVAAAGDLNGDGRDDVVIGAPGADPHGNSSGRVWVIFGTDADCNENGVLDLIDISCGTSADRDDDGVPDECAPRCDADLDGSGDVGFDDLLALLAAWGPCGVCLEDLDENGIVGFPDLLLLLVAWGPCPS